MAPRLNLGRVDECAARFAERPRGEKKLGLRIGSDVSRREMQSDAGHRYRLPTHEKLGSRGQLFRCIIDMPRVPLLATHHKALICSRVQATENRRLYEGGKQC
jgi:hypothetical protein